MELEQHERIAPPVGSAALDARVAEMVDAGELDSPDPGGRAGSNPVPGTPDIEVYMSSFCAPVVQLARHGGLPAVAQRSGSSTGCVGSNPTGGTYLVSSKPLRRLKDSVSSDKSVSKSLISSML